MIRKWDVLKNIIEVMKNWKVKPGALAAALAGVERTKI